MARLLGLRGTTQALIGIDQEGAIRPIRARMATALGREDIGCEVAVLFENGDPARPMVMGVIRPWPLGDEEDGRTRSDPAPHDLELDGERLVLTGKREIVLRCGEASITLTQEGKVLLRGTYLSNTSSGVNRIKGGSVQVN